MIWDDLIKEELNKPYFQHLVEFLRIEDKTKTILPPKEDRLSCFKLTPFEEVKVVILGQDPYHNYQQAHGLAFSVKNEPYPPSLRNIFKELIDDLKIDDPSTGNLTSWAKQGVLLLNTCLTVEVHKPLSHKGAGWELFTEEVIRRVNEKEKPVVFILWGAHAQSYRKLIKNHHHLVIESVHPSPLSALRGFFGSKPFSRTNAFLVNQGLKPIDWSL
jgi:uracil-DNA glycosylase